MNSTTSTRGSLEIRPNVATRIIGIPVKARHWNIDLGNFFLLKTRCHWNKPPEAAFNAKTMNSLKYHIDKWNSMRDVSLLSYNNSAKCALQTPPFP